MLTLRTYALYDRSKWILAFLVPLGLGSVVTSAVMIYVPSTRPIWHSTLSMLRVAFLETSSRFIPLKSVHQLSSQCKCLLICSLDWSNMVTCTVLESCVSLHDTRIPVICWITFVAFKLSVLISSTFDASVFILTLCRTYMTFRELGKNGIHLPLHHLLIRDGSFIFQMVCLLQPSDNTFQEAFTLRTPYQWMISRFVLIKIE